MKIAICVIEIDNERFISPSLTEANYYLIFDSGNETPPIKIINSYSGNNISSEIFCSQLLISKGVNKVICNNCESDAKKLFKDANVGVIENFSGTFKEKITNFLLNINSDYLENQHEVASTENNFNLKNFSKLFEERNEYSYNYDEPLN
ncbi:MAG: NifB/NifX family molybdenum-iron cluster-binding protein [Ignavibacteriae bacterium]|nr:NifB/NifX family molybdenum-iron cluster-binding protein [Ignavibacteriota bacterium]